MRLVGGAEPVCNRIEKFMSGLCFLFRVRQVPALDLPFVRLFSNLVVQLLPLERGLFQLRKPQVEFAVVGYGRDLAIQLFDRCCFALRGLHGVCGSPLSGSDLYVDLYEFGLAGHEGAALLTQA